MTDIQNTQSRLNLFSSGPGAVRAMGALDARVANSGLEKGLVELVRLRVSQINGCAFCVDKHASDPIKSGEDSRRLATLQVWREQ